MHQSTTIPIQIHAWDPENRRFLEEHIQGYETHQTCNTCNETETMEHILTHCRASSPRQIWDLAKNTWPHDCQLWPHISLGIILGCGSISVPETKAQARKDGQPQMIAPKGAKRLL
jgi:hypothetical protein